MEIAILDHHQRVLHRVGHRDADERERHENDRNREQHDQRRRTTITVAEPALQPSVQRIERGRQDHRPEHQVQKRLEHLEAENHQPEDEARADQYIEQFTGKILVSGRRGLHRSPPG